MKSHFYKKRTLILVTGVFAMLFAGVLYAWSILKVPFANHLGFEPDSLTLNFTLTMSFFCIGGVLSSRLVKLIGTRFTIISSAALAGLGFALSGTLGEGGGVLLYLTYALMAGLGIGISYITIISTVNSWFPDRTGLSSGALMMGFGASSLVLGNIADVLFDSPLGFRGTYYALGISICIVLVLSSFVIKRPSDDIELPSPKRSGRGREESVEVRDYTPAEMLRRFTFWRAFIGLVCLTAVGSSVISFARDLALFVGADVAVATTLVGVLSVFNGLGRILTGALFDALGRRFTMIAAAALTVCAAAVTLLAVSIGSLSLCIIGLCLTGLSYGTSPTVSSAFVGSFYGQKHFASNLGLMNFNLMIASFTATACSALYTHFNTFVAPFVLLLVLSLVALALNVSIKKP